MECQKILNLLNEANDSKFVTRKRNIVNDNSKASYGVGSEVIYSTEVLKSNFCDYIDVYILVRGDITIIGYQATQVALCTIYQMYHKNWWNKNRWSRKFNLIEYSSNYSETTGRSWFYSKDEATDFNTDIANDNTFKSFKYKARLLGNTEADNPNLILKGATIVVLQPRTT